MIQNLIKRYNILWDSQSKTSADSMPLGEFDAGDDGDRIHFDLWTAVNKSEVHINYSADKEHRISLALL